MLDESGYTEMWQKDRSADAAGRLENLKELVRSMEEFENLQGFLEHVSLVMDRDGGADDDAVSLMTLHSAKGLEFDTVFLPGWEEGLFPHQRALDEQGRAGLEEERRLAHVGITRARRRAKIYFATNRRIHGTWNDHDPVALPRRTAGRPCRDHRIQGRLRLGRHGGYGASRFDDVGLVRLELFDAGLAARPGQPRSPAAARRLQRRTKPARFCAHAATAASPPSAAADHRGRTGREIHRHRLPTSRSATACFTRNSATATSSQVDGNKLTIAFDKAGEKRVVDSFVERV